MLLFPNTNVNESDDILNKRQQQHLLFSKQQTATICKTMVWTETASGISSQSSGGVLRTSCSLHKIF